MRSPSRFIPTAFVVFLRKCIQSGSYFYFKDSAKNCLKVGLEICSSKVTEVTDIPNALYSRDYWNVFESAHSKQFFKPFFFYSQFSSKKDVLTSTDNSKSFLNFKSCLKFNHICKVILKLIELTDIYKRFSSFSIMRRTSSYVFFKFFFLDGLG